METLKVILKYRLSWTLCGERPTLSYSALCTLLAIVANVVNKRPVALGTLADDFAPLTKNQMLIERTPEVAVEHLNDLDEQYFRASKYQRDLLDMWWKRWKQQGFASLQPYNHLKKARRHPNIEVGDVCLLHYDNWTYRPCQVLKNEISMSGQTRTVKVGYEEGHGLSSRKKNLHLGGRSSSACRGWRSWCQPMRWSC